MQRRFGLSRKFQPPPPAIAMEGALGELVPTQSFKSSKMREFLVRQFTNTALGGVHNPYPEVDLTQVHNNPAAAQTGQQQALLNALAVQLNALENGDLDKKVDQAFVEDFQKWLRGLSCYNADLTKTPWGTKRLVGDDINAYLAQFVERKFELAKFLAKMDLAPPGDLKSAWLYYKYKVANLDPEGLQYLPEYSWLTDPKELEKQASRKGAYIQGPRDQNPPEVHVQRTGAQDAGAIYPLPQDLKPNSVAKSMFICESIDSKNSMYQAPIDAPAAAPEAVVALQQAVQDAGGAQPAIPVEAGPVPVAVPGGIPSVGPTLAEMQQQLAGLGEHDDVKRRLGELRAEVEQPEDKTPEEYGRLDQELAELVERLDAAKAPAAFMPNILALRDEVMGVLRMNTERAEEPVFFDAEEPEPPPPAIRVKQRPTYPNFKGNIRVTPAPPPSVVHHPTSVTPTETASSSLNDQDVLRAAGIPVVDWRLIGQLNSGGKLLPAEINRLTKSLEAGVIELELEASQHPKEEPDPTRQMAINKFQAMLAKLSKMKPPPPQRSYTEMSHQEKVDFQIAEINRGVYADQPNSIASYIRYKIDRLPANESERVRGSLELFWNEQLVKEVDWINKSWHWLAEPKPAVEELNLWMLGLSPKEKDPHARNVHEKWRKTFKNRPKTATYKM